MVTGLSDVKKSTKGLASWALLIAISLDSRNELIILFRPFIEVSRGSRVAVVALGILGRVLYQTIVQHSQGLPIVRAAFVTRLRSGCIHSVAARITPNAADTIRFSLRLLTGLESS